MLNRVQYLLAAALPMLVACASSSSESEGEAAPSPYSNVITRAELQDVGVRNAYEAVERLRPRWLTVRGMRSFNVETEIVVFQDRMFMGGLDMLRTIGIEGIYELRYLDGPTASASLPGLGGRHVEGAIVIYMSPPG
jgi:hypothetical protein